MSSLGISEAATVAGSLRIKPIELSDSRQVRLQRILPRAQWKPSTAALLIPESEVPRDGVVAWVTDVLKRLTSAA